MIFSIIHFPSTVLKRLGSFLSIVLFAACSDSDNHSVEQIYTPIDSSSSTLSYIGGAPANFSEVDPTNISLKDEYGDDPAWVEFYNSSEIPVNLNGLYLTDDIAEPRKWQFGDVPIAAGEHAVVFLSGKNLPNFEAPSDSFNMIGPGVWSWADNQLDENPGTSFTRPYAYNSYKSKNDDGTFTISAEMQYGENETLGWHSACLFVGIGSSSAEDTYDLRGKNELLLKGFVSAGTKVFVQLAQPDIDDYKGFGTVITGTGDSNSTYSIALPQNKDFPDLEHIYGTRLSPENNEMGLVQLTFTSYIARKSGHAAHASFKIKNTGGVLYLTNGEAILDSVAYPELPIGKTWGTDALGYWGYADPSPRAIATTLLFPTRAETLQLPPSGFYTEPFYLSLESLGSEIRCETSGAVPTATSPLFVNPTLVSQTSVFRCAAFQSGALPGPITSRTYVFEQQPTLATVFLTGNPDAWFNPDTGIYMEGNNAQATEPHYGANYWKDIELPIFVEFFEPNIPTPTFSENAGYQIFGNYSRMNDKKSAAIVFKEKYGKTRLHYTLFPEYPQLNKFRVFLLRNNGSNFKNDYIRDRLASSVSKGLGVDYQKARPAIVFYNGVYFGIHNIRERSTEYYFETNYDLEPENIDLLKADHSASNGSAVNYLQMVRYLETNGAESDEAYAAIQNWMDVDNFMNYMHVELFANNRDWPSNNLKKWRSQSPATLWKWFLYDLDGSWGNQFSVDNGNIFEFATTENGEPWPNGPESTFLLRTLLTNAQFKTAFINRFAALLATRFAPTVLKEKIDIMMAEIKAEIPRDQERWNHSTTFMSRQLNNIYDFAATRRDVIQSEMQEFFDLTEIAPVTLSTSGSGTIAVHILPIDVPATISFFKGLPVTVSAIPGTGSVFSSWSDGDTSPVKTFLPEELPNLQAIFK